MRRRKTLSCLLVLLLAIPIFGSPMPAQTLDKLDPLVQQRVSLLAGSSEVIVRATDSASVGAVALLIQQVGGTLRRELPIIDALAADVPNTSLLILVPVASAGTDPATTFSRKCTSCHTFGKGILVGPDLKGVTDRHEREWLISWITSSETLIRKGDRQATALFEKFKQRMPDQSLSAPEIEALLDYFAADGPEADARRKQRRADTATAAEIGAGRALFTGERALLYGGGSCISCHRLGEAVAAGGTLGPDLSTSYARYQDKGLAALLRRGCFPRAVSTTDAAIVTDEESFALRAFLHHEMKAVR